MWIARELPDARLLGLEVNHEAVTRAREQLPADRSDVQLGSLYDLAAYESSSVDVVFTSGVLMHVPHDRVVEVVSEMTRIAAKAVVHFELHGPSHRFDFHRYPRDYAVLYGAAGLPVSAYDVFPPSDFRSAGTSSFRHALLVSEKS